MREDTVARPLRTWPALLMLLLVTVGLFTMHTLGHFSPPGTAPMAHGLSTAGADVASGHGMTFSGPAAAAPMSMPQAEPASTKMAMPALSGAPLGPMTPMVAMVACVAVLCGLIIAAAAAMLARWARLPAMLMRRLLHAIVNAVRGPPPVPIGLWLADLSVARN